MCIDLDELIAEATGEIHGSYFELPTADGDTKWRERNYAYEFYHQMRKIWPEIEGCPLIISGEVDKAGHQIFEELGAGAPVPDFLIHEPGTMCNNLAVIEVKSQKVDNKGICRDIRKLLTFKYKIEYKRIIYLFFGPDLPCTLEENIEKFIGCWHHVLTNEEQAKYIHGQECATIEFWHHESDGKCAECIRKFIG